MKPTLLISCFSLLAIATLYSSCKKEPKPVADETAPLIDVAEAQTDSVVLTKTYPGTISAGSTVDVVGRVNGQLISQNYTSGQKVVKGQVLFQIESTKYRDAVTQAEAALSTAKSQYDYATRNYQAMQKAYESDAVSQMELLQSKNAMETAKASISNATAALETARTNLSYCTVRAPISGTCSKATCSAGTYVNGEGSAMTLATIYDNSTLNADFYVEDVTYIRNFADTEGCKYIDYNHVPVNFSEKLPHSYDGPLTYIAPDVETGTGSMLMRVAIQSPYGELRDGMYATITLPYATDPDAVIVKDASIGTSQDKKYLYVVNDSNKIVYTPVEIGDLANDSMRIITSGLRPGQKYVTKALLKVRPGMTVNPRVVK